MYMNRKENTKLDIQGTVAIVSEIEEIGHFVEIPIIMRRRKKRNISLLYYFSLTII